MRIPPECLFAGLQGAYEEMDTAVLKAQGKPYAAPAAIGLPQVGADQITYVTDMQVCSKAVSPYNANAGYQATGTGISPRLRPGNCMS
jgi:hypothetical protein